MKHYVSVRLIDLFPFDKLYSFAPELPETTSAKFLLSKDLIHWYNYNLDNNTWDLVLTKDLRYDVSEDESEEIWQSVFDNGILNTDLSSLTWDDFQIFWEAEDFDPNMLGIAYAYETEQDFIFINKIKAYSNWKNSFNEKRDADVYIKIPDTKFNYRIVPPTPLSGISFNNFSTKINEDSDEDQYLIDIYNNKKLPTTDFPSVIKSSSYPGSKFSSTDNIGTTKTINNKNRKMLVDIANAFKLKCLEISEDIFIESNIGDFNYPILNVNDNYISTNNILVLTEIDDFYTTRSKIGDFNYPIINVTDDYIGINNYIPLTNINFNYIIKSNINEFNYQNKSIIKNNISINNEILLSEIDDFYNEKGNIIDFDYNTKPLLSNDLKNISINNEVLLAEIDDFYLIKENLTDFDYFNKVINLTLLTESDQAIS